MAKEANAGEFNTRVRFYTVEKSTNENGFAVQVNRDVFGEPVHCKWVWAHGSEVFAHMRDQLGQVATLTMYATNQITPECRVALEDERYITGAENGTFEIVSIDQVENRGRFMELKVRRRVKA